MAINKAKVAIGFMVVGVLAVILGIVFTFVGPIIIDDQVVKVSRLFGMIFFVFLLSAVTLRVKSVEVLSQTLLTLTCIDDSDTPAGRQLHCCTCHTVEVIDIMIKKKK